MTNEYEGITIRGYKSIAEVLRRRITAGDLQGKLAPESELMAEFGCARETVRRALGVLINEELIQKAHGVGYFVRDGRVERSESLPRYAQIADELARRIRVGEIAPDGMMPSESQVQKEFLVSRTTARRVYAELDERSVIELRDGRRYARRDRP